ICSTMTWSASHAALSWRGTDDRRRGLRRGGAAMSKAERAANPVYSVLPREIQGFDSLAELALDMQWSWNHATDDVWRELDPVLWELTHNPWAILQTVSRERIEG